MNQRFPDWLRLIVSASALIQLCFGIALMAKPALIGELWSWTMSALNIEDHSGVACGTTLSSSLRHSPSSNNAA